jgi:mersacidin/lichenicidin family type 2 lantibiotic
MVIHALVKKEIFMDLKDILRAWLDTTYRESLTEEQRALLPDNPIGEVLSEEELLDISGGITACWSSSVRWCSPVH